VVEVTGSDVGDAPMLPELLAQIPADQDIASVTAHSHGLPANRCRATDGAYDTRKCHDAIHCPAVHVYMHERGRTWGRCSHAAPQERQATVPAKPCGAMIAHCVSVSAVRIKVASHLATSNQFATGL
jgi:hypothetical protein